MKTGLNPYVQELSTNPVQRDCIRKIWNALKDADDLYDHANFIAAMQKVTEVTIKNLEIDFPNQPISRYIRGAQLDWKNWDEEAENFINASTSEYVDEPKEANTKKQGKPSAVDKVRMRHSPEGLKVIFPSTLVIPNQKEFLDQWLLTAFFEEDENLTPAVLKEMRALRAEKNIPYSWDNLIDFFNLHHLVYDISPIALDKEMIDEDLMDDFVEDFPNLTSYIKLLVYG